jgi:Zn-dependent peptidase ImmA (M78 family)
MNIFGLDVKVIREKGLCDVRGLAGYFDPAEKKIVIDAELKGRELLQTLLHEFDHALSHRIGLFQARISSDVHEIKAETFTTFVVENLSDAEVKRLIKKFLKN